MRARGYTVTKKDNVYPAGWQGTGSLMRSATTTMAWIAASILGACSYGDLDDSRPRRPSSWSTADGGKADPVKFMRTAEFCDDLADRKAVKDFPLNDPGSAGLVMRQRRVERDSGFYRCMVSFDWLPRAAADEAIGLKAVGNPQAKVWNSTTQRWEDYKR